MQPLSGQHVPVCMVQESDEGGGEVGGGVGTGWRSPWDNRLLGAAGLLKCIFQVQRASMVSFAESIV